MHGQKWSTFNTTHGIQFSNDIHQKHPKSTHCWVHKVAISFGFKHNPAWKLDKGRLKCNRVTKNLSSKQNPCKHTDEQTSHTSWYGKSPKNGFSSFIYPGPLVEPSFWGQWIGLLPGCWRNSTNLSKNLCPTQAGHQHDYLKMAVYILGCPQRYVTNIMKYPSHPLRSPFEHVEPIRNEQKHLGRNRFVDFRVNNNWAQLRLCSGPKSHFKFLKPKKWTIRFGYDIYIYYIYIYVYMCTYA